MRQIVVVRLENIRRKGRQCERFGDRENRSVTLKCCTLLLLFLLDLLLVFTDCCTRSTDEEGVEEKATKEEREKRPR